MSNVTISILVLAKSQVQNILFGKYEIKIQKRGKNLKKMKRCFYNEGRGLITASFV